MSLPATDTFPGADSTTVGSNWTQQFNGWGISSTRAVTNEIGGGYNLAFWNADSFNADHYSEVKIAVSTLGNFHGPSVRASGTGTTATCYAALTRDIIHGQSFVYQMVGGTPTTDIGGGGFNLTLVDGDLVRLSITGSTYTLTVNSSVIRSGSDVTLTFGSAGIVGNGNGISAALLSAWEGGNVGSTGGSTGGGPGSTAKLGSGFLMMGMQ